MMRMESKHWVRLRVPLTWALGLTALVLAEPTPFGLAWGLSIAALGEALRVWAAGHLIKGKEVTRSGPYRWTRNPLYLGSSLMGLGFCIAAARWEPLVLLGVLVIVVERVVRIEAEGLSKRHPEAYEAYARSVPLFFPSPGRRAGERGERRFSWARVRSNKEQKTVAGWLVVAVLLWAKMIAS